MSFSPAVKLLFYSLKQKRRRLKCQHQNRSKKSREKVANLKDILEFSKASKRSQKEAKIDDSERLRPEELDQKCIEAFLAENHPKMGILSVNDLDVALHNFVYKDGILAFKKYLQYNLEANMQLKE